MTAHMSSSRKLMCLIKGESNIFSVAVSGDCDASDLKEKIARKRERGILKDVGPQTLELWKVNIDLESHNEESVSLLRPGTIEGAEKSTWSAMSKYWPHQPPTEHLHVIVKIPGTVPVPAKNLTRPSKQRRRYSPPLQPPLDASPRSGTVSALYERLQKYAFIQVRGTSAFATPPLVLDVFGDHQKPSIRMSSTVVVTGARMAHSLLYPNLERRRGELIFTFPQSNGVELLRDGDWLSQHWGRFSKSGMYTTTLPLSDYIILDCRTTRPALLHPNLPKLYHVIFSDNFSDNFKNVSILNNKLECLMVENSGCWRRRNHTFIIILCKRNLNASLGQ